MKKSKLLSPFIIFFLIYAAVCALYINFAFLPLLDQTAELTAQHQTLQQKIADLDRQMQDAKGLDRKIEDLKNQLVEKMGQNVIVSGIMVSNDVYDAVEAYGITLKSIHVGTPSPTKAASSMENGDVMHSLPIQVTFSASYDEAVGFLRYFENHEDGAYYVQSFEAAAEKNQENSTGEHNFSLSLSLYYFAPDTSSSAPGGSK